MAWTAATSQALVETAREKLIQATQAIELYIQVNNPGQLALAQSTTAAVTTALTALNA